ncbi:MAG: two-component system, sensor histidine kinase [Actinomycetota bacterium]
MTVYRWKSGRASVVVYVLLSFGACILALGAVMATTTASSFARDRKQASVGLESAARRVGDWEVEGIAGGKTVLEGLARQDSIASLDPKRCKSAFEGLESVADQGSIYLLAPDKTVVCSLVERRRPVVDVPTGAWFDAVQQSGQSQYGGVVVERATGVPQAIIASPVTSARGTAVIVAALDTASVPIEIPPNALPKTISVELDKARQNVLVTSTGAPQKVGALPKNSWMRHPLAKSHVQRDADGVVRIYEEVPVKGLDRVVYAGVARSVALQAATTERTRNVALAAGILLLVGYLGFTVQRQIARPIARLQAAIHRAGEDGTVQAPTGGPSEIAALADEFNTTMAKRHDLEVDLAASVARAEEASHMKSLFLANVSHEIRTPMNGVLGMIGLLRDESLTADQRDYLDTMNDSASGLMAVINDLLDFSRIEAGMIEIETTTFDLRHSVRSAVSSWVPAAKAKGVELTVSVSDDAPAFVTGDEARLRQVVSNLVDNAVKFTADGAVTVSVHPTTAGIRFEVIDSGIGIGTKTNDELFEAFVQGDPSTTRRFGGTGLGLAICKQLVALLHGHIDVAQRADGAGSVFFFELPLATADDPVAKAEPAPPAAICLSGVVLVAEDNVVNQKVARAMIEQLGFEVDIAANGREAVDMVARNSYVAVLMDLQMPVMDGFEATATIRDEIGSTVPVYALSASVLPEDVAKCEAAGMNGHLGKPIDRAALRDALERAVTASAL